MNRQQLRNNVSATASAVSSVPYRNIKIALLCIALLSVWGCSSPESPAPSANLLMAQPVQATAPGAPPTTGPTRTEHDLLGNKEVPADAYYGVQTARALENFQLSGIPINHYPGFIEAWAIVKLAAARANTSVGAMKPERLQMIEKAAQALLAGKYRDQFQVDWYQGGAG